MRRVILAFLFICISIFIVRAEPNYKYNMKFGCITVITHTQNESCITTMTTTCCEGSCTMYSSTSCY